VFEKKDEPKQDTTSGEAVDGEQIKVEASGNVRYADESEEEARLDGRNKKKSNEMQ
jgi:hypothetical protein